MDGQNQANQGGRLRQMADEKRDDGAKTTQSPSQAEKGAIQDIDDSFVLRVLAECLLKFGHGVILPSLSCQDDVRKKKRPPEPSLFPGR